MHSIILESLSFFSLSITSLVRDQTFWKFGFWSSGKEGCLNASMNGVREPGITEMENANEVRLKIQFYPFLCQVALI